MLSTQDFLAVVRMAPLVSIDLIVHDTDDRVLVGLRRNLPARGWWFVPGGRIRKDECIAQAFARIAMDELGTAFLVEEARFMGVYEHLYPDNFADVPDVTTHYVVLGWEIRLRAPLGELPASQHREYAWLTREEIRTRPDVHPNTRAYFTAA